MHRMKKWFNSNIAIIAPIIMFIVFVAVAYVYFVNIETEFLIIFYDRSDFILKLQEIKPLLESILILLGASSALGAWLATNR